MARTSDSSGSISALTLTRKAAGAPNANNAASLPSQLPPAQPHPATSQQPGKRKCGRRPTRPSESTCASSRPTRSSPTGSRPFSSGVGGSSFSSVDDAGRSSSVANTGGRPVRARQPNRFFDDNDDDPPDAVTNSLGCGAVLPRTSARRKSPRAPRRRPYRLRPWTTHNVAFLSRFGVILRPLNRRGRGGRVVVDEAALLEGRPADRPVFDPITGTFTDKLVGYAGGNPIDFSITVSNATCVETYGRTRSPSVCTYLRE